jgi:hypothetical protein
MELQDVMGPGYGPFPKDTFGVVVNNTGTTLALGDLIMLDMNNAANTSLIPGNILSPLSLAVLPNVIGVGGLSGTTTVSGHWFGIVVDLLGGAGAASTGVKVQFQGIVKKASLTSTAATIGLDLVGTTAVKTLSAGVSAGKKVLGKVWEPNGGVAGNYQIIFDGINGLGVNPLLS